MAVTRVKVTKLVGLLFAAPFKRLTGKGHLSSLATDLASLRMFPLLCFILRLQCRLYMSFGVKLDDRLKKAQSLGKLSKTVFFPLRGYPAMIEGDSVTCN